MKKLISAAVALSAVIIAQNAYADPIDGTAVNFQLTDWSNYNPSGPPSGNEVVFESASGTWGDGTISWGIYNELDTSGDSLTVSINAGSSPGVYDVIQLPDLIITDVTVTQAGANRYGGTFGADLVSFDAHDIFLNLSGDWNVYDPPRLGITISATTVPEPISIGMLGIGLFGIAMMRRRAQR